MSTFNHAKLAAAFRPFGANISGSVYQEGFAAVPSDSPPAVSLPAESPPAVPLPAESPPAVPLPVDSPPAVPLPAESPPTVSLPAESPSAKPPPEGDGPLVAFDRAFAALISFQQKGRYSFANVATFNLDPPVTSASVATRYKLLSLPVPRVPENLTWSDVYPVWVNETDASCPKIPEPSYPDWLTSIDAIVAHVPCDEPSDSWAKDVRWLHHLLTITSFVIRVLLYSNPLLRSCSSLAARGWLPVVLLSTCRLIHSLPSPQYRGNSPVVTSDDTLVSSHPFPFILNKGSLKFSKPFSRFICSKFASCGYQWCYPPPLFVQSPCTTSPVTVESHVVTSGVTLRMPPAAQPLPLLATRDAGGGHVAVQPDGQ
ncbi:unnamed protein product [Closterium sp. NIES-53]